MRIHIISCRIFSRELSYLASQSDNQVDITWVGRGLHNTPEKLCARLKDAVGALYDQIENGELESRPDFIALGYGLCSRAVVGIKCRSIPIVIPRTDDCIAVFLGSQDRYMREFAKGGGAYWLNSGWIEQSPRLFDSEDLKRRRWLEYAEKYGEDNADYLIEIESSWEKNYNTICYLHSEVYDSPKHIGLAEREAEKRGWSLKELRGDNRMLKMLVDGNWNEEEFLVLKPGEHIEADYSGLKLKAALDDE